MNKIEINIQYNLINNTFSILNVPSNSELIKIKNKLTIEERKYITKCFKKIIKERLAILK